MTQIVCNGRDVEITEGGSIEDLLRQLNLAARPVAVEVNKLVIPRGQHATTLLSSGDQVEVVSLVGGG